VVPDEVLLELFDASPQTLAEVQRRYRLVSIQSQGFQLLGTTLHRMRIPDNRSVADVVRVLAVDPAIAAVQPNYLFALQQNNISSTTLTGSLSSMPEKQAAQYAIPKLRLKEAHNIAKGDGILVAVIDSGIDSSHPELASSIAGAFDTLKPPFKPHAHGTAIAGLICSHVELMGTGPAVRILAIRAFEPGDNSSKATTFNLLRSLEWAAASNAKIINMSFAGSVDPSIRRSLEALHKRDIILVAAAGNAGPLSPPLYPASDAKVIAVTATDAEDKLFRQANRGPHIAVAAPGADLLTASPAGGYQLVTGTSFAAAEVSGIIALMLQHRPNLTPNMVRQLLMATAKDLGPTGRDDLFGAGLVDAYRAVTEPLPRPLSASTPGAGSQ
jgi:subtilisin family serine protease